MSRRLEILPLWVEAVRSMDPKRALEFAAPDFVFLDGDLPEPVTHDGFADYLLSWESRMRELGGTGRYEVIDEVIQDSDSILLKWGWWQFTGTDVQGASLLKITDEGVTFEKIAYYKR
jgi:ketosteroid isomerase-like protein